MTATSTDPNGPYTIIQGDLARTVQYQLLDGNHNVVNLAAASSVAVKIVQRRDVNGELPTNPVVISAAGSFVNAAEGIVQYQWTGTDTNVPGDYDARFTVTWPIGLPDTFPSDSTIQIIIYPSL